MTDRAAIVSPRLLTVPEVAAILRLSRSGTYELVSSGALLAVRIGRSVRVRTEMLERFINEREGGA